MFWKCYCHVVHQPRSGIRALLVAVVLLEDVCEKKIHKNNGSEQSRLQSLFGIMIIEDNYNKIKIIIEYITIIYNNNRFQKARNESAEGVSDRGADVWVRV